MAAPSPYRLALACLLLLVACAHLGMARTLKAPSPSVAPATASAILVAYLDPACVGINITGVEDPFFGDEEAPTDSVGTFEFAGVSPDSPAICSSPEVSLVSSCTSRFLALRAPGSDQLFLQPAVGIQVADSPECAVSHCQGGVATMGDAGGSANGTFYDRKSGDPTFPFSVGTEGSQVTVTVETPLGFSCTLFFNSDATDTLASA